MLKGKIHRATVIQAELDYVGSITVMKNCLRQPVFWNMKKSRSSMSIMAVVLKHTRSAENAGAA